MAATLTQDRFTGRDWVFERKFDGIRLLAYRDAGDVRLFSRNRLPQVIPPLADAIGALPVHDIVLDGEVTWDRASAYHVFDVLWLDGCNLMAQPLDERRRVLERLPLVGPLHLVDRVAADRPWEVACARGWEGVIAKRRDSPYEPKRSKHWLKMKCELTGDFTVGGFTDPQGARVGLGALLVGRFEGPAFVFAGKVGTGFDTRLLLALRERLDAISRPASPFTRATGLPRLRAHWVEPQIRVRVAFIEWTVHRKLRHSRLLEVLS